MLDNIWNDTTVRKFFINLELDMLCQVRRTVMQLVKRFFPRPFHYQTKFNEVAFHRTVNTNSMLHRIIKEYSDAIEKQQIFRRRCPVKYQYLKVSCQRKSDTSTTSLSNEFQGTVNKSQSVANKSQSVAR